MNFFYLIFPCVNIFLYFARPPHKFSNGPFLTSNGLMGMYFPRLDRTVGDAFSLELLELNRTFSVFGGSEKSGR